MESRSPNHRRPSLSPPSHGGRNLKKVGAVGVVDARGGG
ncbi:hypothetical protein V6Z11_A12G183600 [Gossypium hirsutum]